MDLLKRIFKPKVLKQFERHLSSGQYKAALALCDSDTIPETARKQAQYKLSIFEAVSEAAFTDPFRNAIHEVAVALKDPSILHMLPEPDQILIGLARVANALKKEPLEEALDTAVEIKSKTGRAQALCLVANQMACMNQSLERKIQVAKTIPHPGLADEMLRNLLLSKILLKEFDTARNILPHISQEIRRGLRPQIDFVERNLDSLDAAQKRARDLVHPDDIALNLALVAGAMEKFGWMAQFSRSVSPQIMVGTHVTYATSLACAGKRFEAISLLENIQDEGHEYYLHLSNLAINFPLAGREADRVWHTFAKADHYEGALAFWHHQVVLALVAQDIDKICIAMGAITNSNLREALAVLLAEFAYDVQGAANH